MQEEWKNLLIDVAIAKNHQILNVGGHHGIKISQFESIIVSGLFIRAVSVLDKGLEQYIESKGLKYKTRNPKLYHRLLLLDSLGLLEDYEDIDGYRERRNDVGHEVNGDYTWDELDSCLNAIFRELEKLEILESFPSMILEGKIQSVEPTAVGVKIEQDISFVVKSKEKTYHTFGWKVRV